MKKPALFLLTVSLLIPPLSAREITVIVNDIDLDMPLEGAVVKAVGVEYETDADGRASVITPDLSQTTVQIAYPGYENARISVPANGESTFTVGLRLGGDALENEELIVEAQQTSAVETKTGRSVSVSGKDLARTAEIGVIEDVMTSIKLLPGVGYTGMFNARPSIRGGEPGDLVAVFDGFYISNPYYWGGGASIFDPRMVQSASLSHGVFSARYGHTISGLLEITSRKPDPRDAELELGLSTSSANLNASFPFAGKGGLMLMGRVTYWDPFVELAKLFINEVSYVKTAPYIRSASFSTNYQFTPNFGGTVNGFIGGDGAGAFYKNDSVNADGLPTRTDFNFDWGNLQGFLITGLTWTPKPSMVAKATLGGGFLQTKLDGYIEYDLTVPFSEDFKQKYGVAEDSYTFNQTMFANMSDVTENWQARADYDWELGKGFLFSAGAQGLYAKETIEENDQGAAESEYPLKGPEWHISYPVDYNNSTLNQTLTSSAYTLLEWASPANNLGAELGLRVDHLALFGKDFTLQTQPAFNPRLNIDWSFLKNKGVFDSITAVFATGLFSSMTDNISSIQSPDGLGEIKQNRSWTSVAGLKFNISNGYSVNVEGYYKSIFDRAYSRQRRDPTTQKVTIERRFDGEGRIFGFDLMLQRASGRFWDGWLAYSFNIAQYRNPALANSYQSDWYYPSFHRFHNLNLVLNIKPTPIFNIATRLGFASGAPKSVVTGDVETYPVWVVDKDGNYIQTIQKYRRDSAYSDTERDGFALTLDVKFSWFFYNSVGRGRMEFYFAVENALSFLETKVRNTSYNQYTGKEDEGSNTATYQLPIPMPSIGFRWSY
ncbi:MAG: TonB-dependent receptor plug domain-containing protein [Treponema sp.]|jgi:hypothetical protein|nr:TonB-dependent receptor plug domain-containing protein [Treponema sp.]